jgi:hypothetical protein
MTGIKNSYGTAEAMPFQNPAQSELFRKLFSRDSEAEPFHRFVIPQ